MPHGVELGREVGYVIRFENNTSPDTRIRFLTDGSLVRECLEDPLLHAYSVIMLDEAHERSIHTDVLLGLIKSALKQRCVFGPRPDAAAASPGHCRATSSLRLAACHPVTTGRT